MERATALTKLRKLLGKDFRYRIDNKAPTREEREAAKAAFPLALAERKKIEERKKQRYEAILAGDTEYQALAAEFTAARKKEINLSGILHHYKITVGKIVGPFFSVKAEGDSWEDVIKKVDAEMRPRVKEAVGTIEYSKRDVPLDTQ